MKGVVLAGGKGTRLRPLTHSIAKQLVPVANHPIISYGLEDLAAAGVTEIAVVVSPATGPEIRQYIGDGSRFGIHPHFVVQDEPNGIAAALALTLPFVDDDDCILYLGDNLIRDGVRPIVGEFLANRPNAQILLAAVDHPERFGVAELGPDGRVVGLEEKPAVPRSNLALAGVYLFDSSIGDAVTSISPSARGELEITDAIQWLIDAGKRVTSELITGWWKDTGHKADLLHANRLVLETLESQVDGEIVDTRVDGTLSLGAGSKLVDCKVRGRVVVGAGTVIERSELGPNTAIGDDCHLSDCAVEESIVMEATKIGQWRITQSLIGRDVVLGLPAPSDFVTVDLGEHSRVGAM